MPSPLFHDADNWIDAHRAEMTELLAALIAARTENPPGDERLAAKPLAEFFDRHGIPHERLEAAPGRTNIVGRVGAGAPALLLPGHLDVVPAGEGWDTPPYQAVLRAGRVYGRGAKDNKGPTAACALAAACARRCLRLKGQLIVAGVADEERGSHLGLDYLLREGKLRADYAIVPDTAGNLKQIYIAEKGLVFVEIVSHGRQAHGSRPELGCNAIWNLIHLLGKVRAAKASHRAHPLLTPPTHNLGIISGGSAPNLVPARASAVMDFRILPGHTPEETLAWLRGLARETERELPGARFDLNPQSLQAPTEVPEEHPLVQVIRRAAFEVTGHRPTLHGCAGSTVAKQLLAHGIIAVGYNAGDEGADHMANESIDVEELLTFARILLRIAVDLLGHD
jgi:acetylornithine deacetylase/succinyl-diaminopimelate desuccinylase family protein